MFAIDHGAFSLQAAGDAHGAEVGSAHRAELSAVEMSFAVVFFSAVGVEAEVELVFPAELIARLGEGVVANLRRGMSLGEVSGVGSDFVGNDSDSDVFSVGQREVFFRSDITQHGCAERTDVGSADGRSDVVIAGSDVRDERAESVERCFVTLLDLALHVFGNLLHGDVSRSFNECLDVVFPSTGDEFAHGVEFRELCRVVGVGDTTGAQAVAKGNRGVIGGTDFADVVEVFVEEVFAVVNPARETMPGRRFLERGMLASRMPQWMVK